MKKTVVVTGASKGVGRKTCIKLLEKNHSVIALARSEPALRKLKQQYTDQLEYMAADLTNEGDLREIKNWISEIFSDIHIIINNAGALVNKPFTKLDDDDWQQMLDVNLMIPVRLVKMLLPMMTTNAHILNISSMGGFQGSSKFAGLTAYSVAKGGLNILTECLAAEFADRQIACNALCLGSVQTEMFERAFPDFEADVGVAEMGTYVANFALNGAAFYNGKILPVALQDPS